MGAQAASAGPDRADNSQAQNTAPARAETQRGGPCDHSRGEGRAKSSNTANQTGQRTTAAEAGGRAGQTSRNRPGGGATGRQGPNKAHNRGPATAALIGPQPRSRSRPGSRATGAETQTFLSTGSEQPATGRSGSGRPADQPGTHSGAEDLSKRPGRFGSRADDPSGSRRQSRSGAVLPEAVTLSGRRAKRSVRGECPGVASASPGRPEGSQEQQQPAHGSGGSVVAVGLSGSEANGQTVSGDRPGAALLPAAERSQQQHQHAAERSLRSVRER